MPRLSTGTVQRGGVLFGGKEPRDGVTYPDPYQDPALNSAPKGALTADVILTSDAAVPGVGADFQGTIPSAVGVDWSSYYMDPITNAGGYTLDLNGRTLNLGGKTLTLYSNLTVNGPGTVANGTIARNGYTVVWGAGISHSSVP